MFLNAISDLASSRRGKWIVAATWFALTAAIVPLAPTLQEVTQNDAASFLPANSESTRVNALLDARFPNNGTPAIIVFRNPNGLTSGDNDAAVALSRWLTSGAAGDNLRGVISVDTVPQARGELISNDGTTMTIIANITGEPAERPFIDTIERIRQQTAPLNQGDLQVKVSGPAGLLADLIKVFQGIDGFLLVVTAVLVLVLLVLIYRSPVVALVPLVSVGWVFTLAGALGALLAREFGLPVNGQATGIMTVLLFGAGTDYCLFISSRYREELAHAADKHDAMRHAMRGVNEAIASSAGTVLIATLALLLASLRSNQALGPLLAIAIGVMLVAGLTLVPALLTILGRWSFWPFRPRVVTAPPGEPASGAWTAIAGFVLHRPVVTLATTVGLFLILALGALNVQTDYDSLASLPSESESAQGFELLRQSAPPGELAPTAGYLTLPQGTVDDPANLATIERVTQALAAEPYVARVTSPSRPYGADVPVGPNEVAAAIAGVPPEVKAAIDGSGGVTPGGSLAGVDPNSPIARTIGIYAASSALASPDRGVARFSVTLNANPYATRTLQVIPVLRNVARDAAADAGLPRNNVLIGGETAISYDTKVANNRDTRVVLPIILLAIGAILGMLLRSLVAPLYLLATILLSYFATLGLSSVVFQNVLGQSGMGPSVPFLLFIFLVALGVDYNIFLMARVREETIRHGLRDGTARALSRTGGVITSAGIILAGTFAALMTLPLRDLFQLGFAVAAGVLLDTFIVRTLIVPAIVMLLGRWNWWPSTDAHSPHARAAPSAPARPT